MDDESGSAHLLTDRQLGAAPPPLRVLCLDGGGYLGIASAAFLRGLEGHFNMKCHQSFDVFVGTSTGGIIALALACGLSAQEVVQLYIDLGQHVFPARGWPTRAWRTLRALFRPKYSQRALRAALERAFGDRTFQSITDKGKCCVIPAFDVRRGTPRIFKTNHAANLTRDAALKLVDVGLATCAAPTYFGVAAVHNPLDGTTELFSDGGLYANNPALIGLVEALTYLGTPPERVQLLSVSTPRADLRISANKLQASGGLISWLFLLPEIFVETPSMLTERAVKELAQRLKVTYVRLTTI